MNICSSQNWKISQAFVDEHVHNVRYSLVIGCVHSMCVCFLLFCLYCSLFLRLFSSRNKNVHCTCMFSLQIEREFYHRFIHPPRVLSCWMHTHDAKYKQSTNVFIFYEKLLHSIRHIKWRIKCKSNFVCTITTWWIRALFPRLCTRVFAVFVYGFLCRIIATLPT